VVQNDVNEGLHKLAKFLKFELSLGLDTGTVRDTLLEFWSGNVSCLLGWSEVFR
jgi:hypothetical protein